MSDQISNSPRLRLGPLALQLAKAEALGEPVTPQHLERGIARLQSTNSSVVEAVKLTNKNVLATASLILTNLEMKAPFAKDSEFAILKDEIRRSLQSLEAGTSDEAEAQPKGLLQ